MRRLKSFTPSRRDVTFASMMICGLETYRLSLFGRWPGSCRAGKFRGVTLDLQLILVTAGTGQTTAGDRQPVTDGMITNEL